VLTKEYSQLKEELKAIFQQKLLEKKVLDMMQFLFLKKRKSLLVKWLSQKKLK
jgi:hypothetical protein